MKKLCLKCNEFALPNSNYCENHQQKKRNEAKKTYKKLKREIYGNKRWRNLREKVMLRDLYTCQICGTKAEKIHHIIELSEDIRKAYDIENLVSLCRDCHFAVHREKYKQKMIY